MNICFENATVPIRIYSTKKEVIDPTIYYSIITKDRIYAFCDDTTMDTFKRIDDSIYWKCVGDLNKDSRYKIKIVEKYL